MVSRHLQAAGKHREGHQAQFLFAPVNHNRFYLTVADADSTDTNASATVTVVARVKLTWLKSSSYLRRRALSKSAAASCVLCVAATSKYQPQRPASSQSPHARDPQGHAARRRCDPPAELLERVIERDTVHQRHRVRILSAAHDL